MADCTTPRIVALSNWGRAANAHTMSIDKVFHCAMIAPDSEADSVELHFDGQNSYGRRVLVSKDAPYFGKFNAKGMTVYPTVEVPADSLPNAKYSHRAKIMLYPSAPPYIPHKRADARYSFQMGNGEDTIAATVIVPLIPAFGRNRAFFTVDFNHVSGTDIDLVFEGGRVPRSGGDERVTDRWGLPTGVDVDAFGVYSGIDWYELDRKVNVAADTVYSQQYEGDFDFYRVKTENDNIDGYAMNVGVVLKD